MPITVDAGTLDQILALQLTVGWAGEGLCKPPRLGWWRTDLVDPAGGGDLLQRLLPKTHRWGALEAVREAARRVDAAARARTPDPDQLRTLFFLGFELDERLTERLAHLKHAGGSPPKALPFPVDISGTFSPEDVADVLRPSDVAVSHEVLPEGRRLKGT
jgi:hypothetical protein